MPLLIEVGGYDGRDSLVYHERGYTVFTFEPEQNLYAALAERTRDLARYTAINKAVSLVDGTIAFNVCKWGGASSILPFKSDSELISHWTAERYDIQYSGVSYPVQSTRLDTFIREQGLENTPIDFLHVDAQGADLDVLKSLGIYAKNVREGVIESAYSKDKAIYENQNNTVDSATAWLEQNGFKVTNVIPNDPTQCECNICFQHV